jgi:hypothetical protein
MGVSPRSRPRFGDLTDVAPTVRDTFEAGSGTRPSDDRQPAYDQFMADHSNERAWTPEEVRREEQAERARVRRDGARGVTENLKDAVAHTEFAKRFADAFKRTRRV